MAAGITNNHKRKYGTNFFVVGLGDFAAQTNNKTTHFLAIPN